LRGGFRIEKAQVVLASVPEPLVLDFEKKVPELEIKLGTCLKTRMGAPKLVFIQVLILRFLKS
jgi:hypothetical protein